jgi:hypothetical protein
MLQFNWLIIALAALIPLATGALWYSKMLFANSWMRAARVREDEMHGANMALTFGLTYVLSFLLAIVMNFIVIHQFALYSIVEGNTTPEAKAWLTDSFARYGTTFRTFRHGVIHGAISAFFTALPLIGVIALFERKGFKYVAIHVGYWMLTMALMGGVICQWT